MLGASAVTRQYGRMTETARRVAIIGGNRIPFARAHGAYANAGNQDMLTAANCLDAMDEVGPKIGVTGFCIGGRIAYLLATRTDEFAACADFYGGEIEVAWGDGPTPLSETANLNCPLAGYFGNDDYNPTPEAVDVHEAELKRLGKSYEFHRYEGANHAFNDPFNPVLRKGTGFGVFS